MLNILGTASLLLALTSPLGPGLHFVDVGQGSALILDAGDGGLVVVDSGPASGAEALLRGLDEHAGSAIDLWIHTHHDADHLGGFAPALAGFDARPGTDDDLAVAQLWDRGLHEPLPTSEAFALYLARAGTLRERPGPGRVFEVGALRVEVLELPPVAADAGQNNRGLALCVEVGGLRALLPGDLSASLVELAARDCGPVDVLWSSHHGAVDGSSLEAIAAADPVHVVISAGHDNTHCHPSSAALAAIHDRTAWILDAAGVEPRGSCPALAPLLGPDHALVGGDLWIGADGTIALGGPGGWVRAR